MNTAAWLKKALRTDRNDEADKWRETHPDALDVVDGHYATDGFRIHWMVGYAWPTTKTWTTARAMTELISEAPTSIFVSTEHLVRACNIARVLNPQIVLSIGNELLVGTTDAEVGDVLVLLAQGDVWPPCHGNHKVSTVTYGKSGPDMLVKVNSRYVLHALSGMGSVSTISILPYEGGKALFFSSANQNRAVVMGLIDDDKKGPYLPQAKKEVKDVAQTDLEPQLQG